MFRLAVYLRPYLNKLTVVTFHLTLIMYPFDGIRSQLEWNSVLSTNSALPTDLSKHHRKVRYLLSLNSSVNTTLDGHYRHNWYPWRLKTVVLFSNHLFRSKGQHCRETRRIASRWYQCRYVCPRSTSLLCFHS